MEYYVISPNVWNDKKNLWKAMFDLNIAAVGWSPDDTIGQQLFIWNSW